jgi:hypothetical protein
MGSMFSAKNNLILGWMIRLMSVVFALIYTFLWSRGIGAATWTGWLVGHILFCCL